MAKKQVSVMNTAFRDGFQSVFGARVFTKDFLPALEAAVDAGFTHFEAGGGARAVGPQGRGTGGGVGGSAHK